MPPPLCPSSPPVSSRYRTPARPSGFHTALLAVGLLLMSGLMVPRSSSAQPASPPAVDALLQSDSSAMIPVVERFAEDRDALRRRYDAAGPTQWARMRTFYNQWLDELNAVPFDPLGVEGRIDHLLLRNDIQTSLQRLDRTERRHAEMEPYLPFASTVTSLYYWWRDDPSLEPRAVADTLAALRDTIRATQKHLSEQSRETESDRVVAHRAANTIADLRGHLEEWYAFYDGYHPDFAWWVEAPYTDVQEQLKDYRTFLRRDIVGVPEGEERPLIGDPIGTEALEADLRHAMIPYTPDALIEVAEQELAWGKAQMRRAARDMGHGDDWRAALEAVKARHVDPGQQPSLAQNLAEEAVSFLRERDLVTIPPMAEEVWRMQMLSPDRQEVAPYFLGGEVVRVAFPAREMSHENKLMSIRGNNRHFSRAVVHHELIPGHHLQGFMTDRYNAHRDLFSTPFWGEGWALYWEMYLWDLDFPESPADRMGMLFWRNHRAARIIFSLRYHMGEMSAQEAVDFLVREVGHERANAEAEVRRSIIGTYPPLYQAAYMLGGLQFRALHEELVTNGDLSDREFHDRILRGGRMPVEMVRARLRGRRLPKDYEPQWHFAGAPSRK
ncbi:DUF885 family protein [Salinibacter altiplanensis]|uniref:DUF885 family protein n=1 Tax=Salinibacter altiplanensis TaxID=1803181 RepID=UPI000C9F7E5F|nr:DUF885 family protein [Salinibacter altiplanensis]